MFTFDPPENIRNALSDKVDCSSSLTYSHKGLTNWWGQKLQFEQISYE